MQSIKLILFLSLCSVVTFGQPYPATKVYPSLSQYTIVNGFANEQGFQFIAATRIYVSDTFVPPGLLLQLNPNGDIIHIDTLRNYRYHNVFKVDTILLLSSYHFNKYPDTISTVIFELCDLHGNPIRSYEYDVKTCFSGNAGVAQVNDSIYIVCQSPECFSGESEAVHYYVNINTLDIQVKYHQKGGFIGNILKIDNEPRYLEWLVSDIWLMDTTFEVKNKILTDTVKASQNGTLRIREDKPGWFGFGGCFTPSGVYELCMIALDEQLKLEKVDVIYHPPSGNWYIPTSYNTLCKQGNSFYVTGQWNVPDPGGWWNNKTPTHVFIAKYDLNLDRVWTKIVGGDRRYWPMEIHPTKDDGFMIAGGLIDNLDNFKKVPFTMFFDADGEIVGTHEPAPRYYDFTIYGNPGREALRIMARFEGMEIFLQVVNAMGQPMLRHRMTEGMNELDTSAWPSGTYLMSITDKAGQALWSQPWIRE